jgi:hypothetical protein
MKSLNTKPITLILFTLVAFGLSGCGKSNSASPVPPGVVNGQYNGYPNGGGAGQFGSACTPIQSPIQFSGVMYIDSANVMAGVGAPPPSTGNGQNYGALQMSSSTQLPAATYGVIAIQAQMMSPNGATGGGTLTLSPAAIQQAALQSGMPYGQFPCATVVGIQLTHYNTLLYGGTVQLMINGNVPYSIYF